MSEPGDPDRTLASTLASDAGAVGGAPGDEAFCAACNKSYPFELDTCPADGARLAKLRARPDLLIGRVFDNRYEIRDRLGEGGMGTVYKGWQLSVDREVAIKVIHSKLASDRTAVKRFLREARLSSRLSQPSIVNVFDFGQTDDGVLYIVMELLRGHTLAQELRNVGAMPVRRVLDIARQLCDALASAHGHGIVHRDLKPGNIVILDDPPGRDLVKVLDFGLAKSLVADSRAHASAVTDTSVVLGTPLYMAPEQAMGDESDQRADLYALGCILFHMFAGRPPFERERLEATLAAHISEPPPPLPASVPPHLVHAVMMLLEKSPAARPATASTVRDLIGETLHGHVATPSAPPSAPPIAADAHVPATLIAKSQPAASIELEMPTRRRWLAPLVIAIGGGIAIGGYLATRSRSTPAVPSVAPADAAPFVDGATPDAGAIDAIGNALPDAATKPATPTVKPPKPKPTSTRPQKPTRPAEPDVPFLLGSGSN